MKFVLIIFASVCAQVTFAGDSSTIGGIVKEQRVHVIHANEFARLNARLGSTESTFVPSLGLDARKLGSRIVADDEVLIIPAPKETLTQDLLEMNP